MIPKIIHQTWKTDQTPIEWQALVDSWKTHHPDWEYKLWTNEDGYRFVEQYYPSFYEAYCNLTYDIQRADAIRYVVVHHFGGLYVDMDYECLQPFDALLEKHDFIIGFEPAEHAQMYGEAVLCNALFAAQPKAPFLSEAIERIEHSPSIVSHNDVLSTTGPLLLQKILEHQGREGLSLFAPNVFCPLSANSDELIQLTQGGLNSEDIKESLRQKGAYAIHYWSNSWVSDLAGKLYNPTPHKIDGFKFYPNVDSPGHDLFNGKRDIPTLSQLCLEDEQVVAFNTDGFAKTHVLPNSEWQPMRDSNDKQGLYIKVTALTQAGIDDES